MARYKGYRIEFVCVGEGKTEDEAIESLADNMFDNKQNIEHGSGEDFLVIQECELED